jgi:hypothetical protein
MINHSNIQNAINKNIQKKMKLNIFLSIQVNTLHIDLDLFSIKIHFH